MMIAEARECIKTKKEELKDATIPSSFGTSVSFLQSFFKPVMPQLFPQVTEVRGENISHKS